MTTRLNTGLLKATLAKALNLPAKKVDYPHRVVQEAQDVAKGKRGRGGVDVTPRDSAITLIAVLCSFIADEVLIGERAFAGLQINHTANITYSQAPNDPPGKLTSPDGWNEIDGGTWQNVPRLKDLPAGHTFADALTVLIEIARDNAIEGVHGFNVVFSGPEPAASIEIDLHGDGRSYKETAAYFLPERAVSIDIASAFEITVKIDHQPIYALGKLFRKEKS